MLSEELRAQGWIEHSGGPCPVGMDDRVRVLFPKPERERSSEWLGRASIFNWNMCIAYKPETPDA